MAMSATRRMIPSTSASTRRGTTVNGGSSVCFFRAQQQQQQRQQRRAASFLRYAGASGRAMTTATDDVDRNDIVDVWCFDARTIGEDEDTESGRGRRARAYAALTREEREELSASALRAYARAFTRKTLMRYVKDGTGGDPQRVVFALGARGKPRVSAPSELTSVGFSVSHCDGLVAVCVTRGGECGVDVEDVNRRRGSDVNKLATRWLSAREIATVEGTEDADERARVFMQTWTVKEAYVKATGLGIAGRPFREFDVDIDVSSGRLELSDGEAGEAWRVALIQPNPETSHALALCAPPTSRGGLPEIRLRWASPFDDHDGDDHIGVSPHIVVASDVRRA